MEYVLINDFIVREIKEMDEESVALISNHWQWVLPIDYFSRRPSVGWIFDKGVSYPDIKPVTPRQIRQAWILSGRSLDMIDSVINTLPEPNRSLAKAEWEYSTLVFRNNKLVGMLGSLAGFTADQLDDLWNFAYKL